MSLPTPARIDAATQATWPPAATRDAGPFRLRDGGGGGKRVSAATALRAVDETDLPAAEAAMRAMGQAPLFQLRQGDAGLDAILGMAGYRMVDPVVALAAPVVDLARVAAPDLPAAALDAPTAAMADIWAEGGIGPERLAVMARVAGPRAYLSGERDGVAAAAAFVALDGDLAMLHALEVATAHRRHGLGRLLMRAAATWAQARGATVLSVLVTRANAGAGALYAGLGMEDVGGYHYRIHPAGAPDAPMLHAAQ